MIDGGAKLPVQAGDRQIMYQLWIVVGAIDAYAISGRTGIVNQVGIVTHVAGHAHRGFDTKVSKKADNNQPRSV